MGSTRRTRGLFFSVLLFSFLLFIPNQGEAYVFGSSDMNLSNLSFSSSNPVAQVIWSDLLWYGTVSAHAQDTDSGSADDFDDLLGNDGDISAIANTAHVHSTADYSVTDGDLIPVDPNASLSAATHSDIEIHNLAQGDGHALADFDNFFTIVGGVTGDPVDVTFTLDFSGQLTGDADASGFFSIALAGLMSLEDLEFNVLDQDAIWDIHSGSNTFFHQDYTGTLSVSATLLFEEEYWLFAETDSEVYGVNVPEPATMLLVLIGTPMVLWNRRKHLGTPRH